MKLSVFDIYVHSFFCFLIYQLYISAASFEKGRLGLAARGGRDFAGRVKPLLDDGQLHYIFFLHVEPSRLDVPPYFAKITEGEAGKVALLHRGGGHGAMRRGHVDLGERPHCAPRIGPALEHLPHMNVVVVLHAQGRPLERLCLAAQVVLVRHKHALVARDGRGVDFAAHEHRHICIPRAE